jgi:cell division protein FtsI (penicillin-binding protein 3)
MLLCFTAVVGRLVQVQVVQPGAYLAFGASQRFQQITLAADRGSIFDRNGNDLAVSIPQRTVWADPRLVPDPAGTAARLGGLLSLDAASTTALTAKLASGKAFTYVERRVPDAVADQVAQAKLPGIFLLQEPQRFDPSGDLAKSVLGQVGVDNEGLSGLELQYDKSLTGQPGSLKVERDPGGRTIPAGQQQLQPAKRGDDLVLTLDRSMQYETERALATQITAKHAKGGTAIVSNPTTGEILALANMSADPTTGQVSSIADDTAVTASYEPGSVNKVVTVSAAIEEGLVSPSTQIVVPDQYKVGDALFTDHVPHPTASYSVTKILSDSSNVGTIKIAQMLGADRFDSYLRRFGFGQRTDLGLPYETGGILLPRNQYNSTSLAAMPIGQGIAVSAMQMLEAYNVIANDGIYVPPKLVMDTVDQAGARHPVATSPSHRVVSASTAQQVRDMLANVVSEGTGSRGGISGYTVAGKTGTARKPNKNGGYQDAAGNYHYVATFAGFVPAERPELSIIVVIDEPTGDIYGGSVAAPVFADLAQYGLRAFHIPPPLVEHAPAPDTVAAATAPSVTATVPRKLRAAPAVASPSTGLTGATTTIPTTTPTTAPPAASSGSPPSSSGR